MVSAQRSPELSPARSKVLERRTHLERRFVRRIEIAGIKKVVQSLDKSLLWSAENHTVSTGSVSLMSTGSGEVQAGGNRLLTFPPIIVMRCAVSCGANQLYSHDDASKKPTVLPLCSEHCRVLICLSLGEQSVGSPGAKVPFGKRFCMNPARTTGLW